MRYVMTVNFVVEADEGHERSLERTMGGLFQNLVECDKPPFQLKDFGIESVVPEREWKKWALMGE